MCPCLALIKDRGLCYDRYISIHVHGPPYVRGRTACFEETSVLFAEPWTNGKSYQKYETPGRDADARMALPLASLSLCLCDFSQSRLLINFQIVNVKVIVAPFHRGADKPASINIPVSGCRSGWYDIHGLIPSLLYRCCHRHVNFSPGGSRMPSKSAYSTAGEMLFNCLLRRGTGRQCAITPAGLWRIEGGDKTVLKSCNFSTAWRRLFAPILVNNAWRVLNAPVSKDCSLPSAHFVLLGFPRKDNCRLSHVNICLLTPIIPHNLGLGVFGLGLD